MDELVEYYSHKKNGADNKLSHLIEEIAFLEGRLLAIGQTGDCAYEKSLSKTYRSLLCERRKQLNILRRKPRLAGFIS
jgi:hypothetical protein